MANGQLPAPPHHASPATTVQANGRNVVTVGVHGDGKGFWLVLGQSQSKGWQASTSNGHALGTSTLIDGYANGWYVPGSDAKGPITITMTWTPQRVVNLALLVSGATLVLSLVLILFPRRLLARRRRPARGRHATALAGASADVESDVAMRAGGAEPYHPRLTSLLRSDGAAPSWRLTAVVAALGALAVGFFVHPLAGVLIGGALVAELRVARARAVVAAGVVGLLAALTAYMVWTQHHNHYLPDIIWPVRFSPANSLAWLAVCLLAVDGLVQFVRHRVR
jgi:hypothetical protein